MHCRDTLTGRHHVQLSEWWADFDERVMRPVFNKPDAMEEWTPRGDGTHMLFMRAIQILAFIIEGLARRASIEKSACCVSPSNCTGEN